MKDIKETIYDRLANAIVAAPVEVHEVLSILGDGFFDPTSSQTIKVNQDAIIEAVMIYKDTIINDEATNPEDYKKLLVEQIRESVQTFSNR